jgi:hypothetical protein
LAAPLRSLEDTLFRSEFGNLERIMFRFFDFPRSEKDLDRAQILDSFTRLLEQRQQFFRDQPGIQRTLEKLGAAGAVHFSVRIAGYSSLNLDLSTGAFKSLAEAFDNDFDSFRVFLEAFVPQAFGEVFSSDAADRMNFTVQVPASYEKEFVLVRSASPPPGPGDNTMQPASQPATTTRERAEWLWRLANGSLLVPLLLALLVMYQGMSMLKDIHASQAEAMKPILEYQLKLLEEDRHRLFKEPGPVTAPAAVPSAATK